MRCWALRSHSVSPQLAKSRHEFRAGLRTCGTLRKNRVAYGLPLTGGDTGGDTTGTPTGPRQNSPQILAPRVPPPLLSLQLHSNPLKVLVPGKDWQSECKGDARNLVQDVAKIGTLNLNTLLNAHHEQAEYRDRVDNDRGDELHRLSNLQMFFAMEHAFFQGTLISWKDFQYTRPPAALTEHESRYMIDWTWPDDEGCPRRRSCVHDALTGKSRFEVPLVMDGDSVRRRKLHLWIDQSTKGWSAGMWAFHGRPQLRGTCFLDRSHTVKNILAAAAAASGLAILKLEWVCALSVFRGPFQSGAHGNNLFAAGRSLMKHATWKEPSWQVFYMEIAWDLEMNEDVDVGSDDHMRRTYANMKRIFLKRGRDVKIEKDRWFSLEQAFDDHRAMIATYVWIICYWGAARGRWKTLASSPLENFVFPEGRDMEGSDASAAALAAAEGAGVAEEQEASGAAAGAAEEAGEGDNLDDGGDGAPMSLAKAKETMKSMRSERPKHIDFAGHVFGSKMGRRLMKGVVELTRPISIIFHQEMKNMRDPDECLRLMTGLATEGWRVVFNRLWRLYLSPEFSMRMGFRLHPSVHEQREDEMIAKRMWKLLFCTIGWLASFELLYTITPPHSFLRLIASDCHVASGLDFHRRAWNLWLKLDRSAPSSCRLASFVKNLYFTSNAWCREVMITLEECEFKAIPVSLRQELLSFGRAQNGTLLNENLNRQACSSARASGGGLGPGSAWMRLASGQTMKDFGRPTPGVDSLARAAAVKKRDLPQSTFRPSACAVPFEKKVMDDLTAAAPSYPTLNAQNYWDHGIAWRCALWHDGDAEAIHNFFPNLLVEVGSLLKRDGQDYGVVVRATKWGVMRQQVRLRRPAGAPYAEMCFSAFDGAALPIEYVAITAPLEDWSVLETTPVVPGHPQYTNVDGDHLRVCATGESMSLLMHGCKHCFRHLTVPMLNDLWTHMKLKRKKPTRKNELVAALMKAVNGELTDEAIELRMAENEAEDADHTCGNPVEAFFDFIEEDEEDHMRKEAEELRKEVQKRAAATERLPMRHTALAAVPAAAAASARTLIEDAPVWSQPLAKRFIPPGCKITRHLCGGRRWTLTCPAFAGSHDRSKAFGDAEGQLTSFEALCILLQLAWDAHIGKHGGSCPWEIPIPF